VTCCVQVPEEHYNGRPIPLFGYNRKDGFLDLMFPDFTYFGHEYSQITGAAASCLERGTATAMHRPSSSSSSGSGGSGGGGAAAVA
jgi:hypothetical protein